MRIFKETSEAGRLEQLKISQEQHLELDTLCQSIPDSTLPGTDRETKKMKRIARCEGVFGTAKHPPCSACTITAQQAQSTTAAAPQDMINGLSVRANWMLITLKLDAKGSGLLGTVPGIKRKVTKQWDASRQHPGLHSSAPEINMRFGYRGKYSLR